MSDFKLTPEQEKAVKTLDRHISLTANAGSGKTAVLTDRIMYILEQYAEKHEKDIIKHIVAITFTNLATAQLRDKIVGKIDKRLKKELRAEKPNEEMIRNFAYLREHISQLRIMTIHGFCNSILRNYSTEAELSPSFKVLDPINAKIAKERVFSNLMTKIFPHDIEKGTAEQKKFAGEVEILVSALGGTAKLHDDVMAILGNGINHEKEDKLYRGEDEDYGKKMSGFHDEYIKYADEQFSGSLAQLRDCFWHYDLINPKTAGEQKIKRARDKIETVDAKLKSGVSCKELADEINRSDADIFCCLTTKGSLRNDVSKAFVGDKFKIEDATAKLKKAIKMYEYAGNDNDYLNYSETLYKVSVLARDLYKTEKHLSDTDYIDNDDMLVLTRNLLRDHGEICAELQQDIKFLLVDEFQDTDDVQYDIIKYIISDLNPSNTYSNNLFIVGDPKQSIYKFRNADVEIFNRIKDDIRGANKRNSAIEYDDSLCEDENYGLLNLTATFRLKPFNVAYVNKVCKSIFKDDKQEYNPLVYPLMPDEDPEKLTDSGDVDFIIAKKTTKKENTEVVEDDAECGVATLLCRYIRNLVDQQKRKYSDFGILYPSRSAQVKKLYTALIENKIPYIDRSGGGFYGRPEVRDLVCFIQFMHDCDDDFSFISVLKSDYCGFTDTELFTIADLTSKLKISYFEKLKAIANDTALEPEYYDLRNKIRWCIDALTKIINTRDNLPVSVQLYQFIRNTDWYVTLENDREKDSKIANVEKFIDITRSFFASGFKSYYDFLQFIEYNRNDLKQENQATVSMSIENAVSTQTLHSAKGLEYKHVVLFGMQPEKGAKSLVRDFSFDKNYGFCFSFYKPNPEDMTNDVVTSSFTDSIATEEKTKSFSEQLRLLYVAMTRGKEHLTLCATIKDSMNVSKNNSEKSMFELAINEVCNVSDLQTDGNSVAFSEEELPVLIDNKKEFKPINRRINVFHELEEPEKQIEEEENPEQEHEEEKTYYLLEALAPGQVKGWVSASKLLDYKLTKRLFDSEKILGLSPDKLSDNFVNNYKSAIPANIIGTIVHYVFENFKEWYTNGNPVADLLERQIAEASEKFFDNSDPQIEEQLMNNLKDIIFPAVHSDFIAEYSEYLLKAETEKEMNFMLDGNFFTTIFDVLAKKENGDYEILDWKTNRIDSVEKYNEKVNEYAEQMKLYCYMVYKMNRQQKVYTAKLVFLRLFGNNPLGMNPVKEFSWTSEEMQKYESDLPEYINEVLSYPFYGMRSPEEDGHDGSTDTAVTDEESDDAGEFFGAEQEI